jgi:ATPase, P-type (transporting), HAD superfamily, subfamily IC
MTPIHHYSGLNDSQVIENRAKYGENLLTPPKQKPLWKKFLEKFQDTIIIILLVALLASVGVSLYEYFAESQGWSVFLEPLGIFIAVILATLVGFLFEMNAERKFRVLNQVNDDTMFKVIRNGGVTEVPKKEIVKGDIVLLNSGDDVPADGVLLESVSLQVNESTLTGEPLARKSANREDADAEATYPTWEMMKGTSVVEGHATMEVLAVGDHTEYGKVYQGSQMENKIKNAFEYTARQTGGTDNTSELSDGRTDNMCPRSDAFYHDWFFRFYAGASLYAQYGDDSGHTDCGGCA